MITKCYILIIILIFSESLILAQPFQTVCRNGLNIPITDFGNARDTILINVALNNVLDVNVRIDSLLHTWVGDLSIDLKKNNTTVRLFNNTGGSGDNFLGTLLNDSALIKIDSGTAPFTGTFRPNQALSSFNNSSANGNWILSITDNQAGDTGLLKAWCLIIKFGFLDGINGEIEIPNTYRLYQNYPNPFNPVTKIKYGVPKNGYIKLTVYDGLGKEVDIVDEGYREANTYEAIFDATNLPSGVYYYKLEAKGFAETKKMVIVK